MISTFPPRRHPSLSKKVCMIKSYMTEGNHQQATKIIMQMKKGADAHAVYDVIINYKKPNCWLALIQNPFLSDALSQGELQKLLQKADTLLKRVQSNATLYQIGLALAKNTNLCRKINYASIVKFTKNNPRLAFYVSENGRFLRHLDFQSIEKFIALCPHQTKSILSNLLLILQKKDKNNTANRTWAINVLEWLIIHSSPTLTVIQNEPDQYVNFIRILKERFSQYPYFAKQVLKWHCICTLLEVSIDVKEHSILTGRDYLEIGQHFIQISNPSVASKYLSLALKHKEFYAALSLTTLVMNTDHDKAWHWLKLAIKKLPTDNLKLRNTSLEFHHFLRQAGNHDLADQVLSNLPVKYSLEELRNKLDIKEELSPIEPLSSSVFLLSYFSTHDKSTTRGDPRTSCCMPEVLKRTKPYLFD